MQIGRATGPHYTKKRAALAVAVLVAHSFSYGPAHKKSPANRRGFSNLAKP